MADSNDDCVFESDSDHNESSETLTETESQSVSKEKVKKENQSYGNSNAIYTVFGETKKLEEYQEFAQTKKSLLKLKKVCSN